MSHFCHAEPVEACRDIKHLHSPFDGLRVTVVTFYEFIKFSLGKMSFLVTYHPVTLSAAKPDQSFEELTNALDQFPEATIIFTKANADTAGRIINYNIEKYVKQNPQRAKIFTSMGQLLYLSAIKNMDIVIGNSSSGITEAPSFCKPTVNIGQRQRGRLKADSIIDCAEKAETIVAAIKKGLSSEFKNVLKNTKNPYGSGNASLKIKEYLKKASLENILMKKFYDVNFNDPTGK